MGNRTRAQTRLVGEDAARNALLHTHEQAADDAARERRRVERALEDGLKHARQPFKIQQHHADAQHDVEQRHERHQLFAHAADAFDAAEQHHGHQHRAENADDEVERRHESVADEVKLHKRRVNRRRDGVDLRRVACAEDGQRAEQCVEDGEPLPALAQPVLDVVHRPADPLAGGAAFAVVDGEGDFGVFRAHAQQR